MFRALRLLACSATAVLVCALFAAKSSAQTVPCASSTFVYVNNNPDGANSISAFCVNSDGTLTAIAGSPFATGGSGSSAGFFAATSIAATIVGNFLYASDGATGDVAGFSIDTSTGVLAAVPNSPVVYNSEPADNAVKASLAVTPADNFLYVGDPNTSNIWAYAIAANGSLSPVSGSPFTSPGPPDGMNVTLDGKFLMIALPSTGEVAVFSIGPAGALTALSGSPFAAGGPVYETASIAINCASNLVSEVEASIGPAVVSVQTNNAGSLTPILNSPFSFGGADTNSNIGILSPNDDFLFVSNQYSNTIMSMNVAPGGSLTQVAGSPFCNSSNAEDCNQSSNPTYPELLATNQAGTLLYVVNEAIVEGDNTVNAYNVSAAGGLTLISGSPYDTGVAGDPAMLVYPPKVCGLSVGKLADAPTVSYGSSVGFTVKTSNGINALSTATDVTVSDPLPGGSGAAWSISPDYSGPGSCGVTGAIGSQVLNCSLGNLTAGASASVHVISDSPAAGTYINTASASSSGGSPIAGSATSIVSAGQAAETLSITVNGSGDGGVDFDDAGCFTSTPGGAQSGNCSPTFGQGTEETLTAQPDEGSSFSGWGGACASSSVNPSCTVTMLASQSVTATFSLPTAVTFPLTVNEIGTGSGTVTDNLEVHEIDCSESGGNPETGMCIADYSSGSTVVLTATPTGGSSFAGWTGACSGLGTCSIAMNSPAFVTANFVPPPAMVNLSFPTGTNSTQSATFACPSNTEPCPDPNAHQLSFTIPNVSTSFEVTVMATEVPPTMADGLCEVGHNVNDDFDCRFVTFFGDGLDPAGDTITPHCVPYAKGNCVHYLVYATPTGPGTVPDPADFSGGVYWLITWNNSTVTPPAPYWIGSTPQFYDDPDSPPQPNSAVGTNCSDAMTINGVPQSYFCQFEYNITTFYSATEGVDPGIGGSTKSFNDVVIAYPPTEEGTGVVVTGPLTPTAPALSGTCVMGCTTSSGAIAFAINTGGTFIVKAAGYPPSTITESGALPSGLTFNPLSGILGGTPTSGVGGSFPISLTAANGVGSVTVNYTITVGQLMFSPPTIDFGDAFPKLPVLRKLEIFNNGSTAVTFTAFNVAPVSGDDSSGFYAVEPCSKTLNPGKSCTAVMAFVGDSNVTATHLADFVISDNGPGSPQIVPMVASVINPIPSLSALALNFGTQKDGTISAAKTVTLKNIGTTPLILSGLSVSGNFALAASAEPCTNTGEIQPGGTCTIGVTFDPTSKGPQVGEVKITENALINTLVIVLAGVGD
jgi:uncharacterized repeat protein (TIGR01451 family)